LIFNNEDNEFREVLLGDTT